MKKFLNSKWILLILPLSVLIISLGVIISMQGIFFFHPNNDISSYNELKKDNNYEEVEIEKKKYLIMSLKDYFDNFNLLIMDYPGYGKTKGFVDNDKTFLNFGTEIYDWAEKQEFVDKNNILVMGYSIGTCAATYVASVRDVTGLVLVAPYDEALSLYNDTINVFHGPIKLLTKFKLEAKKYAPNVDVPVLIFASKADEVINYNFSENLSHYFNNIDEFITLENIKHSYYYNQYEVWDRIQNYLYYRINNWLWKKSYYNNIAIIFIVVVTNLMFVDA